MRYILIYKVALIISLIAMFDSINVIHCSTKYSYCRVQSYFVALIEDIDACPRDFLAHSTPNRESIEAEAHQLS